MNITKAAIEKDRITVIALLIILVAGIITFRTMPRSEDPGFIIRTAMVLTYFPGASPERVELLLTDKLEKIIQEMPEIDFINSESKTGASVIFVNIKESYTEMRPIWDKLRRKVERARGDLPDGVIGPIVNDEFGDVFGTIVSISGEGFNYAELKEIADNVRDELLLIEEIAKVEIYGEQNERIFVEYSDARLAKLGLTSGQLMQILASQNIIIPGGDVTTQNERIVLEPTGSYESVEDLQSTLINLPGRRDLVYLDDIAHVYRGYIDPPASLTTSSGNPALALAISLREGGNIIELGIKVKESITRLQELYPIGIEFDIVAFQAQHVDKKVKDFTRNLLQAVLIVMVVMLVFLGIRTGLVVATLVPMAMIMSLFLMGIFQIGLDQMSLAALIISLGLLVDNSIVMSESIMVQMSEGKKPLEAALNSANELRIPLLTSSLTTAAAFLPIYLAESSTGEYTAPLFKVVTITLISSWILSLTMIPFLAVRFLKVKKSTNNQVYASRFYIKYRALLISLLKHPVLTIVGVITLFLIVMQGFALIPSIFFPLNDKAIYTAELEFPIGTPIEKTEKMVDAVEKYMADSLVADADNGKEGIINWSGYIGEGAPRFVLNYNPQPARPEYAVLLVNTTSWDVVPEMIEKTEEFCLENYPDLRADIKLLYYGPPPMAPVQIRISGRDLDQIFKIVESVKTKLSEVIGTKNIRDDWGTRIKKLIVEINEARAQRAGVSNQDIAISLQTALTGIDITQYRELDKVIPVTLRSMAAQRQDIGKLETINVYSQASGQNVPLSQVAGVNIVWQPAKILRRDRLKTVTVECDVTSQTTPIAVSQELDQWLKKEKTNWEVGYKYGLGGELESSVEANQSISEKLPIAALLIILLLVMQFNSIRIPTIILLTIPMGLIGVVIGLIVMRSYFGFMTFLGVISLAGVVINNAIVLIDRIKTEIEEHKRNAQDAIVESGQRRLRPIFLTTATTIGGLIPLYLGGGPMYEPMAVAIIFGLGFATLLTLGLVPVLYSLFFRINFKNYQYNPSN
jgi:multidrug efflux pump subunit AcrB